MKIFSIYASDKKDKIEKAVYIPDGFSFWAFAFNIFWFFYYKIWVHAVFYIFLYLSVAQLTTLGMLSPTQAFLINMLISLYIGLTARESYGKNLERSGYYLADIISANDVDDAEYKYISRIYNKLNQEIEELADEKGTADTERK